MLLTDLGSDLAERDVVTSLRFEVDTLLIQVLIEKEAKCPETQDGLGGAHLVMVSTHEFLEVSEQRFDGPARGCGDDDLFQGVVKATGDPVARLAQRRVRR